ncbi:beta strand repeat-containing protein, partial [Flavobacterium soyangense]|nr:hypothetical protein [Flavobacterium soyangense]
VISAISGNNKTITRTWTATDANANVSSYVQIITVTDTQAPTFTLSPASLTIACSASSLPATTNGPATATDNCATPAIAYSDVLVNGIGNNKTITRTWTATDANANVSSYVQTITVSDTQAPTFTLSPASLTIACSASSLPAATNGPATATDNCATPTIGYSDVISAVSGNNKTITRTWTATDANANVSSYVQTITVTDTQVPTFTLSPASLTIACSASSLPATTNGPATATDNCDTPTIGYSDVISAISGNNKTITRTWTATDANANVSSYVQTITVTDTQAPTFTLSPASLTIACSASSLPAATNGPATATDNCATPTIGYSDVISAISGNNKTITRTWTATDANANVSSYVQTITVTDTQAPTFTLSPASLTIACSASSLPAATNGPATATDNCATPTIGYSDVVVIGTGNNSVITRTWTATDADANVSSYVQTITVNATTAITSQPTSTSVCVGSSASFTVAANGANLTYQWQINTNGNNYANIPGETNPTLSFASALISNDNNYKIIITGICGTITSNIVHLTVNALPILTAPTQVCIGSTATLSPTTNGTWTSSNTAIATVTNAGVITGISAGTATFTYSETATGCSKTTLSVTVNALPIVTAPTQVCIGSTATLSPTTNGTWTSSNTTIATVTNAGVITGISAGTATFTYIETATGCSKTTLSVTVNALPIVTAPTQVCIGSTATLSPTTNGTWT